MTNISKFFSIFTLTIISTISFAYAEDTTKTPAPATPTVVTQEITPIVTTKEQKTEIKEQKNINNNIKILKGSTIISEAEKEGKQLLKVGNVQILVDNSSIKTSQQNANTITITLNNGQTFNISEDQIEVNNKKIILSENQAVNIEQAQNNSSLLITPASDNQTPLKIQDTDSTGNVRTYSVNTGNSIGINNDNSISAVKGDVMIESQGQSVQLKEGNVITTTNTTLPTTPIAPQPEVKKEEKKESTEPKEEVKKETDKKTADTVEPKESTDKKITPIEEQKIEPKITPEITPQPQPQQEPETNLFNEPITIDLSKEPTDFGNDLTDFSPTKLK